MLNRAVFHFVVAVSFLCSAVCSADRIAQKKAERVLDSNAEFIHNMAYLTVTHSSVEFDGTREFSDETFEHHFTFRGKWDDQRGYFSMSFRFASDGRLLSVRNEGRSWVFEPFTTSGALLALVKETVLKEILKDPETSNETKVKLRRFINEGRVDEIVMAVLNFKNGFKN